MDVETQLPSRGEVVRMLKPHLPALTAMAISADRAAVAVVNSMVPRWQLPYYQPKIRGQLRAVLWGEAIRTWVREARPGGLKIHDPFGWVELVAYDRLHVRVQTARYRESTPRRRARNLQLPDQTLPLQLQETPIGNVDLNTHFSESTGALQWLTLEAPLEPGQLWSPLQIGLTPGQRQLNSWLVRDRSRTPWLEVSLNAQRMGRAMALDGVGSVEEILARVAPTTPVAQLPQTGTTAAPGWPASDQPRPTFGKKRGQEGGSADAQ